MSGDDNDSPVEIKSGEEKIALLEAEIFRLIEKGKDWEVKLEKEVFGEPQWHHYNERVTAIRQQLSETRQQLSETRAENRQALQPPSTGGNDRFVDKRVTDALDNCVWALLDGNNPIGVCFFVKSTLAVTAQHNLVEEQKTIRARLLGNEVITLSVVYRNVDLDIAVLKSETDRKHLSVHTGKVEKGTRAILSGYSIGIAENLEESFTESVSVMTAKINKVSQHHLVYQSNAFQGDSGGALVLLDGAVVGMHLAGVNQLKERIKKKKAVNERLTEVEGSIDGIVEGMGQGYVGILCSCISEAICEAEQNVK